jgi:hypothetical protein
VRVPIALAFVECIKRRLGSETSGKNPSMAPTAFQKLLARTSIQLSLGIVALEFSLADVNRLDELSRLRRIPDQGVRTVDDAYIYMYEHFLSDVRRFDRTTPDAKVNRTGRHGRAVQLPLDQRQAAQP